MFTGRVHRLPPLPSPPSPPPRSPFPLIAVIAPIAGAVAIALLTGSAFVLVFAVLGPIIAIATALDARRHARRHRRDEAARFDRDCASWLALVPVAHAAERARVEAAHPRVVLRDAVLDSAGSERAMLRLGTAPAPSGALPDVPVALDDDGSGLRLAELVAAASRNPALPVVVSPGPVRVVGRGRAADALARLVDLHPACVLERSASPTSASGRPAAVEVVIESATRAHVRSRDGSPILFRPEGITGREYGSVIGRRAIEPPLPESIAWSALPQQGANGSLAAVGVDEAGPVVLDLLAEDPHALVGGTTGSGKSEFLRTAAIAWACGAPPTERSILLVDFKGGSAFAALAALPHVVGLITDLDARSAERALRSLRAEVRRREQVLLDRSARDVRELPTGVLARLLVLVDEYAVLVETFPELHAVFADLASRGRSLGVHLVLCTQRPAGVVRDAVAANCATRIAFRLAAPADAAGLLPSAPPADGSPAGRAVMVGGGRTRLVQVATIDDDDVADLAARWSGAPRPSRPWLPDLPSEVERGALVGLDDDAAPGAEPPSGPALAIGLLDDPDRQRRCRAEWRPARDGSLLVIGAEGSGAHDALAVIAESAREQRAQLAVVPAALEDALAVLDELRAELDARSAAGVPIIVIPDIDALVAEAAERSPELLDAFDAVERRVRRAGGALVASSTAVVTARAGVIARFDCVLLLRSASVDDHRAAGGAVGEFDPDAPPGRGRWRGRAVQLISSPTTLPTARPPRVEAWTPPAGKPVAVVSGRPRACAALLRSRGVDVALDPASLVATRAAEALDHRVSGIRLEHIPSAGRDVEAAGACAEASSSGRIAVSDADGWQASWAALGAARQDGVIVLADVAEADGRAVLGHRQSLPMRGDSAEEILVVEAGERPRRARWAALASPADGP